jgi:hypothetical protein
MVRQEHTWDGKLRLNWWAKTRDHVVMRAYFPNLYGSPDW